MAMLAEPRRKEKWTLNPRGKFWSEDKNKFGQRMLEKMGWSEGKGLGASEQGTTSHVAVKLKNDSKGLGSSIKDGEWCRHQEQFENLLANLNDSADAEGSPSSLTSLEEISKNSKKRLHYAKFTRGKDLSLYSKKDLDCILGIGVRKEEKPSTDDSVEDVGSMDTLYGVTTIVGGSVQDYFKKKMTSLSKSYSVDNGLENGDESSMKMIRKRKSDIEDAELMEVSDNINNIGENESIMNGDAEIHNKRKKKRKYKNNVDDVQDMLLKDVDQSTKNDGLKSMILDSAPSCPNEDLEVQSMSKKKKRLKENGFEEIVEEEIKVLEDSNRKTCEKKKKKSILLNGDMLASDTLIVKEKQRKKGSRSGNADVMQNVTEEGSQSVERSKESRRLDGTKYLEDSVEEVQIFQEEEIPEICDIVSKKVKSNICDDSLKSEGRPLKKKCKKKRRNKVDSEEVMSIEELYVVEDNNASEKVEQSTAAGIKSKKHKKKGSSKDKNVESTDEILQIVEVNEDLEMGKNDPGSGLDGEVIDLKGKKRKEKKKKRLINTDDIVSKVDDNLCDTLQPMPKKSKRSKEKKPLMAETNICDEIPTENGLEMQKGNVDKVSISDVSGRVQADSMLSTNSIAIGNEDPVVEQLSEECKGFSDTAKRDGRNLEVSYYSCLKKKEKKCVVSDVLHVFNGANLKDIKGYDAEVNKKE